MNVNIQVHAATAGIVDISVKESKVDAKDPGVVLLKVDQVYLYLSDDQAGHIRQQLESVLGQRLLDRIRRADSPPAGPGDSLQA